MRDREAERQRDRETERQRDRVMEREERGRRQKRGVRGGSSREGDGPQKPRNRVCVNNKKRAQRRLTSRTPFHERHKRGEAGKGGRGGGDGACFSMRPHHKTITLYAP